MGGRRKWLLAGALALVVVVGGVGIVVAQGDDASESGAARGVGGRRFGRPACRQRS
ncbi:MAG: hypothetical protein M3295_07530 [Chloroflexota bacterium]|nr:hypothetical protein [Chloroflexota bacterium]